MAEEGVGRVGVGMGESGKVHCLPPRRSLPAMKMSFRGHSWAAVVVSGAVYANITFNCGQSTVNRSEVM